MKGWILAGWAQQSPESAPLPPMRARPAPPRPALPAARQGQLPASDPGRWLPRGASMAQHEYELGPMWLLETGDRRFPLNWLEVAGGLSERWWCSEFVCDASLDWSEGCILYSCKSHCLLRWAIWRSECTLWRKHKRKLGGQWDGELE